jgi:hypothetical protein
MKCNVSINVSAIVIPFVEFSKSSLDPITNANPVYGHSYTWRYIDTYVCINHSIPSG